MSLDQQTFPSPSVLERTAPVDQLELDRALFVGAKYESYYQAQFGKITPKETNGRL